MLRTEGIPKDGLERSFEHASSEPSLNGTVVSTVAPGPGSIRGVWMQHARALARRVRIEAQQARPRSNASPRPGWMIVRSSSSTWIAHRHRSGILLPLLMRFFCVTRTVGHQSPEWHASSGPSRRKNLPSVHGHLPTLTPSLGGMSSLFPVPTSLTLSELSRFVSCPAVIQVHPHWCVLLPSEGRSVPSGPRRPLPTLLRGNPFAPRIHPRMDWSRSRTWGWEGGSRSSHGIGPVRPDRGPGKPLV